MLGHYVYILFKQATLLFWDVLQFMFSEEQWKWSVWEHYKLQDLRNLILLVCQVHNCSGIHTIYLFSYIKNCPDKPSYFSVIALEFISFCVCSKQYYLHSKAAKLLCKNLPDRNSLFNHLCLFRLITSIPCHGTPWDFERRRWPPGMEGGFDLYWIISHGLLTQCGSTAFGFA